MVAQQKIPLAESENPTLAPPSFKFVGEQLFVGLAAMRGLSDVAEIPQQWREFMSGQYQKIAHKMDGAPVGVTMPNEGDDGFSYVCAARVSRFDALPEGLIELTVAPSNYAVFNHDGHVSELPQTYAAIWKDWFPLSGKAPRRAPSLECHNLTFDPGTGEGGVTLWVPIG